MVRFWMYSEGTPKRLPDSLDMGLWGLESPRMTPRFLSASAKMETPFTYKKDHGRHRFAGSQESKFEHI